MNEHKRKFDSTWDRTGLLSSICFIMYGKDLGLDRAERGLILAIGFLRRVGRGVGSFHWGAIMWRYAKQEEGEWCYYRLPFDDRSFLFRVAKRASNICLPSIYQFDKFSFILKHLWRHFDLDNFSSPILWREKGNLFWKSSLFKYLMIYSFHAKIRFDILISSRLQSDIIEIFINYLRFDV